MKIRQVFVAVIIALLCGCGSTADPKVESSELDESEQATPVCAGLTQPQCDATTRCSMRPARPLEDDCWGEEQPVVCMRTDRNCANNLSIEERDADGSIWLFSSVCYLEGFSPLSENGLGDFAPQDQLCETE